MNDEINDVPDRPTSVNILNLDNSDGNGTHWTVFVISKPSGKLFYADPFANKVYGTPKNIKKLANELGLQLVENKYIIQPLDSNFCGYISIYLAKKFRKFLKKKGRMTEDDFDRIITKSFTKKISNEKLNKLIAWTKKNNIVV